MRINLYFVFLFFISDHTLLLSQQNKASFTKAFEGILSKDGVSIQQTIDNGYIICGWIGNDNYPKEFTIFVPSNKCIDPLHQKGSNNFNDHIFKHDFLNFIHYLIKLLMHKNIYFWKMILVRIYYHYK